ncbi:MAG: hypothetical protein JXQ75_23590 [Phycisphaerae bacterium]|nr:hypothetical protein [Phycisphaerae bacterium]
MDSGDEPDVTPLVGRFVVKCRGQTMTGLAAHEVVAILDSPDGGDAAVYRIHRVEADGRMELVGVSKRLFQTQDCFIFPRNQAEDARADFEAVRSAAAEAPPPCAIEVQLAKVARMALPHVVVLVFPAACGEGVGHWLRRLGLRPGDHADGGVSALQAYRDAGPDVIEHVSIPV